jgi:MFS family permease
MLAGAFGYRVPATGWKPEGWTPPTTQKAAQTSRHVHVDRAWKLPQFWFLWGVLCLNVTAGIGVLSLASPMIQEIFGGRLIGVTATLAELSAEQKAAVASIAAGFTGLLSLASLVGRIGWSSLSDKLGRKPTYMIFFSVGALLYATVPFAGRTGAVPLFVTLFVVILTMYGGGFAAIPAYLADKFGTAFVGAIHGRLLTAWSVAGLVGPAIVSYLRDWQLGHGVAAGDAYNTTMYILAGLLVVGFLCNLMVRPVAERHFMTDDELRRETTPKAPGPTPPLQAAR